VRPDTTTLVVPRTIAASWLKQKTALLYQDAKGDIGTEIPLGHWDEASATSPSVRTMDAGVAESGRFAYSFEKTVVWNASRSKVLKKTTMLRVLGTDGKELWHTSDADAPEDQEPLYFSKNGETMLVLLRKDKAWTASVRGYLGATVMDAGPFARVETASLTGNGLYAAIKWMVPDQSATNTFLDVYAKARKDIPSSDLTLGAGRIDDTGKVFSGKKLIFDFAAQPEPKK